MPADGGRAPRPATPRGAWGATCGCPASARARSRRPWSSSASAARPCSTRPCAARSGAGTSTRSTPPASTPSASPTLDLGDLPDAPASRSPSRSRSACGPTAHARRLQGRRGRPSARPSADDEAVEAELDALRERSARLETVEERRGRAATSSSWTTSARSTASTFEGGEGRDQLLELGSGRLDPGLRGAAHGRQGRRRAHRRRSPSPTTTAPSTSPARTPSSPSRSRRSSARSCPSSTTSSPPTPPASTRSTSCARTSRRKLREADESARRGRVPRGGARRRRRRRDGRGPRDARRRARARAVGADAALARPPGHHQGRLPADRRQVPRRRSSTRPSPTPSRRCAARP